MSNVIEYRVYTLKPGARAAFQQRFDEQILPMFGRFGIEVLRAGPSLHDEVSFCLLRRFPSVSVREAQLEQFYGSEEWLANHDRAVMTMIESYSTSVLADDA